jgi:ferric-chelate reductase
MRPALGRSDISTSFYSTSTIHSKSTSAEIDKIDGGGASSIDVKINQGRPDITAAILRAAKENMDGGSAAGRLAILVCGPASMADEARAAVQHAMKSGCRSIEYIEETFGW